MTFPGYPLATAFTNASPQSTVHPAHHEALENAVNDLQAQVDTISPLGVVGYAAVTANQGSITTTVDLTSCSKTFTAVSGRIYKVTAESAPLSTVAGDTVWLILTTGANTQLKLGRTRLVGGSVSESCALTWVSSGSDSGSTTWKLRMALAAGTGTITNVASSDDPTFLLIEDIGA